MSSAVGSQTTFKLIDNVWNEMKVMLTDGINSYDYDPCGTRKVFSEGFRRKILQSGYVTFEVFKEIIKWKDPRFGLSKVDTNFNKKNIEKVSSEVLKSIEVKDDRNAVSSLIHKLDGIGIAYASAIVTVIDPKNYGIIDTRAWNALRRNGIVRSGLYYSYPKETLIERYLLYLAIIRYMAHRLKRTAREIDMGLWKMGH